ncbi:hypothetical protein HDV00_006348 [Rhizophlyctis rosea]|nr:hypothetical protein HDV00_006348 [Rhizophlyctis rosea]
MPDNRDRDRNSRQNGGRDREVGDRPLGFRGPRSLEEIKRDKEKDKGVAASSRDEARRQPSPFDVEEGEIVESNPASRSSSGERDIRNGELAASSISTPPPTASHNTDTDTPASETPQKKGKSRWESDEEGNEVGASSRKSAKRKLGSKKSVSATVISVEQTAHGSSPLVVVESQEASVAVSTPIFDEGSTGPKPKRLKPSAERTPTAKTIESPHSPAYIPTSPLAPPRRTVDSDGEPTTPRSHDGLSAPPSRATSRRSSPAPPTPMHPKLLSCRSVDNYEKLNRIDEGAYGVVYRARDRQTGEIVALKKLKLEKEKNGFPVTSLREIHTLLLAKHPNIVNVKEIVVTNSLSGIFIAMEFVEHDLKGLMENMSTPFLQSEIKTLMLQLLSAVNCLHQNWIVHRDLKTSNLLMNNRGMIKVADFGLARRFGDPVGPMTQLVVTLWYRAPELLLGAKEYSTAIDIWSIGCIFGELVNKEPLLAGKGELDQLKKIFQLVGTPNERIWPGVGQLPGMKTFNFQPQPYNNLRTRFPYLTENGLNLMTKLLTLDPSQRITAEEALRHPYFTESPPPKDPSLFPTWPAKSAGEKKRKYASPSAPHAHGGDGGIGEEDGGGGGGLFGGQSEGGGGGMGFRLKI